MNSGGFDSITIANNIKEGFNAEEGFYDCYPEGTDENDYTVNIKMANDKVNSIYEVIRNSNWKAY